MLKNYLNLIYVSKLKLNFWVSFEYDFNLSEIKHNKNAKLICTGS